MTGEGIDDGTDILSVESGIRYGYELRKGWIILYYWVRNNLKTTFHAMIIQKDDAFQLRPFLTLMGFDTIMAISFSIASTLGGLTFYYIKRADTISMKALNMQLKLFIAVCAQVRLFLIFDL